MRLHPITQLLMFALIFTTIRGQGEDPGLANKLDNGLVEHLASLQAPRDTWDAEYRVQLEKLEQLAREKGALDLVLEVRKTIDASSVTIEEPTTSAEPVRRLYGIYTQKRKKLELAAAQQRVVRIKQYGDQLTALEVKLTKANKIQDALTVRKTLKKLLVDLQAARSVADALTPKLVIPVPPPALVGSPIVQGVARVQRSPNAGKYPTYRDEPKHSWWAYGYDTTKPISWETEKVTLQHTRHGKPITFIWAGAIDAVKQATFTFQLNDQALFDIASKVQGDRVWEGEGCTLTFELKRRAHDSFGIFLLKVPVSMLRANQVQTLSLQGRSGEGWMMLNDYDDVVN
ncbi:MAG: hypothetical protein ACI9TH_000687 [Kiritimatiellia bacterium]|jgi:hypothetical protein